MAVETPLIELKHVSKKFVINDEEVDALKDVSFSIPKNEFVVIYGESGSGKSTLLDTIVGLQPPSSGTVKLLGQDFYAHNQDHRAQLRAQHFGVVYQSSEWIGSLNVVENVALPLYLQAVDRSVARQRAMEILQSMGLDRYARYNPGLLSGGQQQRVSMARALVTDPAVIVADEPTGNLDNKNARLVMNLLAGIRSQKHNFQGTVILVTHNLEYLSLSDHRIFMADGVMTESTGVYSMPADLQLKLHALLGGHTQGPAESITPQKTASTGKTSSSQSASQARVKRGKAV